MKSLDTGKIITDVFTNNVEVLGEINLQQLYAGKTRAGIDLSPTYLEDPYFDDKGGIAAAQRYSDWKDRISPNSKRRPGVPNLFINGYYYASRRAVIAGDKIVYSSSYIEPEIIGKYGEGVYGLGGEYKAEFLSVHIRPELNAEITKATGLKFNG